MVEEDKYENRKQQRAVQEKISALLLPLKPFLKPDVSEAVDIALRIINNAKVKDNSE